MTTTGTGTAPASTVDDRARRTAPAIVRWVKTRAAWILLLNIALVALFTALSPQHVFWSVANGQALMLGMSQALMLALGLAMMLGAGIFDLSLGANLVLSSVVGALVMRSFQTTPGDATSHPDPVLAISVGLLACVATGLVFGLVNGLLIAVGGINSLIATLGTLGIGTGIAYLLSGGTDVGSLPPALQTDIGLKTIGPLPVPAILAGLIFAALWFTVRYTRFGMRVQAIGSSRPSAERAGIRVRSYLITLALLGGALAGLAGFIDLSRFGSTAIAGHANDALGAVTAAVIGGTLLEGGYISITGTLWGAALAIILQSGLVLLGVSSFWQLIVVGAVLLIAVLLDRFASLRRSRRTTP